MDRSELHAISLEFDERVEEALADSDDLAEYVSELEDEAASDPSARIDPTLSNELVTEIEDFLKER